jgi:glycerol-3-phosphate dehydrogenase (NAD(P)+)
VPSHAFVETIDKIPNEIKQIAWLTKGLEPKSSRFLSSVVLEKSPNALIAILQGPSFAKELALGLPTAITLAHNDHSFGQKVQSLIHTPPLRVYLSDDIIGVQLAGAVKNVLAIAVGISDGLGFGANTKAALITRGLNEMARLGAKLNANKATFMGLAGLGDLLLTATDDQSRNRRFGLLLGQGMSTAHALSEIKQVVEGIHNVEQVLALSKSVHIELPICETVSRILNNKISAKDAVSALLNRPKSYE